MGPDSRWGVPHKTCAVAPSYAARKKTFYNSLKVLDELAQLCILLPSLLNSLKGKDLNKANYSCFDYH